MGISTHILDTTRGRPAAGVRVTLEYKDGLRFETLARGTMTDGRVKGSSDHGARHPGLIYHWITFHVASYFELLGVAAFYPEVAVSFVVGTSGQSYHVPLLLNPFGYSTYRGS